MTVRGQQEEMLSNMKKRENKQKTKQKKNHKKEAQVDLKKNRSQLR